MVLYDNIAFGLGAGEGFSIDFQNPARRSCYEASNKQTASKGFYDWLLKVHRKGRTTMRAPGYPLFGRVFSNGGLGLGLGVNRWVSDNGLRFSASVNRRLVEGRRRGLRRRLTHEFRGSLRFD